MPENDPERGSTGPPPPLAFTATDPMGRVVWSDEASFRVKADRHPELGTSPEWTVAAIEDPDAIYRHADHEDRRIYLGEARPDRDPTYAPTKRVIIVTESSTPGGKFVTGYDHQSTKVPATAGPIEWVRSE